MWGYNKQMEILFFMGAGTLLLFIFWINVKILKFFINKNISEKLTDKQVVYIILVWFIASSLLSLPLELFMGPAISLLASVVLSYGIFYFLLKRYTHLTHLKSLKIYVFYSLLAIVVSFSIIGAVRVFFFQPFVVSGSAMNPTFYSGDYLIINQLSKSYERGDIVVYEWKDGHYFIQRIIGLPGEEVVIEDGLTLVNGVPIDDSYTQGITEWEQSSLRLGENEYFVMGDNRENSSDSRLSGPVSEDKILGEYLLKVGLFSTPSWVK